MNFSSDSVKLEIRPHKEDFYLDVETPRGHFFAVLDFAPHDYVNLTPALKRRLEMVVTSFASAPRFSANLFLGFVALEINNFLINLSKQAGDGPPILCSAALCLVNDNQFSYFLCGDVLLNLLTGGGLVPLYGAKSNGDQHPAQLGARSSQTTLTNQVKSLTLHDGDTVLIMTHGIGTTLDQKRLAKEVISLGSSDPKVIRDALLSASSASRNDRTLVVIGGPYTSSGDPTLAELSKTVAALEARLNTLSDSGLPSDISTPALMGALEGGEEISRTNDVDSEAAKRSISDQLRTNYRSLGMAAVLVMLVIALVGGFAGSWFQSRMLRRNPEVWSVRTSGAQVDIARLDEKDPSTVTFSLDQPSKTTGEQKFSSFSDVKQYLEMLSKLPAANPNNQTPATIAAGQTIQPTDSKPADFVTEYKAKSGDSLMKLAWRNKVSPGRLKELNPNITEWRAIKVGQSISIPSPSPNQPPSVQGETVAASSSATSTSEVTVGPGDSVMKLARRHNVSPEELRKLNSSISKWPLLRIGERITLPSQGAGNSPATSQAEPSASPTSSPVEPPASVNAVAGTKEVRIGKGESLNSLAQLFNCSPRRIKQLNPRIRNWASIHPGQKIVVPAPGS